MEPPGSVELPLAAYRTATLLSVGGVVTSRGIEPRSPALQAGAMTTLARWSEWSRCRGSDPGLLLAAASRWRRVGCRAGIRTRIFPVNSRTCCRCHHPTSARPVKLAGRRGFEPRLAGSEPAVLPLDDLPMVGSGGLEPPRTCTRGRWATDYPTTRKILVTTKLEMG